MVAVIAVGKVEHGGAVQITATALPNGADHPVKPLPDEWEKGRAAYFTALLNEGMDYEPSIEDDYEWVRRGC